MIILEGCDCSGKSTLAVRLAEHYDSPVLHYSAHSDMVMRNHAEHGKPGSEEIVDRMHLSEVPYSMYFRHDTPKYNSVQTIDNILAAGNHVVILCTPPWRTVRGLWYERLDEELVKNEDVLHGIHSWYDTRAERYKTPHMRYDFTMDSVSELIDSIDEVFSND